MLERDTKWMVDWGQYYRDFKALHGEPILFDGRLLFPDGWRYALDLAGPEYPPKPAEVLKLRRIYWKERRLKLTEELEHLKGRQEYLLDLQAYKSCSLPICTYSRRSEQTGELMPFWKLVRQGEDQRSAPLGDSPFDLRIAELETALIECEETLLEIKNARSTSAA